MFANNCRLVSIRCIVRGLGQAFCTSVPHRAVVPCDSTAFLSWGVVTQQNLTAGAVSFYILQLLVFNYFASLVHAAQVHVLYTISQKTCHIYFRNNFVNSIPHSGNVVKVWWKTSQQCFLQVIPDHNNERMTEIGKELTKLVRNKSGQFFDSQYTLTST